jgi:hypothetical protein
MVVKCSSCSEGRSECVRASFEVRTGSAVCEECGYQSFACCFHTLVLDRFQCPVVFTQTLWEKRLSSYRLWGRSVEARKSEETKRTISIFIACKKL